MYRSYARKPVNTEELEHYTAEQIWAAAAFAQRVNGKYSRDGYMITSESDPEMQQEVFANKVLIRRQIDNGFVDVTDEDREVGTAALQWHSYRLMMQSLKGELKSFEQTLSKAIAVESFTIRNAYEIAVIASQIGSYLNGRKEEQLREDIERSPLAKVGEKVDANITVVRSVFSQNYGVFFVTAKTDCRHMVFFSYKKALDADSQHHIKGTVKAHRDDSVTQLNRVKIV